MRSFSFALGGAGLLLLAACTTSEIGPQTPNGGDGKTAVFLTDAPFPFDGISRVDIHIVDIAMSTQMDTSDASPWVSVAHPDRGFNLLELQGGSTALLGEAVVPPGQYRAVRLIFDPARSSMTTNDGATIRGMTAPGAAGINWQAKGERPSLFSLVQEAMAIDQNGEDIVIDFDVGRSFLYDGAEHFTFIPALRAITRAGSGGIRGTLARADNGSPIPNAVVSIHYSLDTLPGLGPLLATSRSNGNGEFQALFLSPGHYDVVAEDLARETASDVKRVRVNPGETAEVERFEF
jgi:Domain of unknown function (DUF4382)/Carboxypeptidase regulatory-like domain